MEFDVYDVPTQTGSPSASPPCNGQDGLATIGLIVSCIIATTYF